MLPGTDVFSDPRFEKDEHLYCPPCAARAPWVGDVLEVWRWTKAGRELRDIEPAPSAALIDGLLTIDAEIAALEDDMHERAEAERKRKAGA